MENIIGGFGFLIFVYAIYWLISAKENAMGNFEKSGRDIDRENMNYWAEKNNVFKEYDSQTCICSDENMCKNPMLTKRCKAFKGHNEIC